MHLHMKSFQLCICRAEGRHVFIFWNLFMQFEEEELEEGDEEVSDNTLG